MHDQQGMARIQPRQLNAVRFWNTTSINRPSPPNCRNPPGGRAQKPYRSWQMTHPASCRAEPVSCYYAVRDLPFRPPPETSSRIQDQAAATHRLRGFPLVPVAFRPLQAMPPSRSGSRSAWQQGRPPMNQHERFRNQILWTRGNLPKIPLGVRPQVRAYT